MKKILLTITLLSISVLVFAQSSRDFSSFGNQLVELKNQIEIYPNPSVDFLNVRIEHSELENTELVVHSIIGSKFKIEIEETAPNEYKLDVRDLPPGYYLLSIKDEKANFKKTFKFLKR